MPFLTKSATSASNNHFPVDINCAIKGHANASGNGSGNTLSLLSPNTNASVSFSLFSSHVHQTINVPEKQSGGMGNAGATAAALLCGAAVATAGTYAVSVMKSRCKSGKKEKARWEKGDDVCEEDEEEDGIGRLPFGLYSSVVSNVGGSDGGSAQYENTLATRMMRECRF